MATNGHSGYPLKWFKDQNAARSSFECAICLEVLKDPVQVRGCGHQFCALCIDDILKTDPRCPSCRITLSRDMVFEDHAARRLIRKLDVNCFNEGCSWMGNLSSLLENLMVCCKFLVSDDSHASQADMRNLEEKLEALMLKVSTLEEKHKDDIEQVHLKRQNELKELTLKYENELRQVKEKHENDLKKVNSKHENDLKEEVSKRDKEVKKLREQMAFLGNFSCLPDTSSQSLEHLALNPMVTIALKITNFTRRLNQAKSSNRYGVIESDPFYTSHGYRMRIAIYLNEGPHGCTGYMGVYMYLMKGDHDNDLKWPFSKTITFIVVDQQNNESQIHNFETSLVPEGQDNFNRPQLGSNSGLGFGQFILHSTLRNRQYIRNHTVYIAVAIQS